MADLTLDAAEAPSPFETAAARRTRRARAVTGALGAALVAGVLASVGAGAVGLRPGQVAGVLAAAVGLNLSGAAFAFTPQEAAVLVAIRLPRVLLSVVAGAGLAASGAVMQGLFRNPLADPGLVGVSSGAALGAAGAIVLGASAGALGGAALVAGCAFAGGLATTAVVYRVATRRGRTSVTTMLLAGIAVNALCGAGVGALVLFADDAQLRDLTFWTLGSLGGATWQSLAVAAPLVLAAVAASPYLARSTRCFSARPRRATWASKPSASRRSRSRSRRSPSRVSRPWPGWSALSGSSRRTSCGCCSGRGTGRCCRPRRSRAPSCSSPPIWRGGPSSRRSRCRSGS